MIMELNKQEDLNLMVADSFVRLNSLIQNNENVLSPKIISELETVSTNMEYIMNVIFPDVDFNTEIRKIKKYHEDKETRVTS